MPTDSDQPLSAADLDALTGAKNVLREAVRTRREARPEAVRRDDDHRRTQQTLSFLADRVGPGLTIAAYFSQAPEPDTLELVAALHAVGARVLLPVLGRRRDGSWPSTDGRRLPDWARYTGPDRVKPGWRGILQPTTAELGADALAEAEVVVCSALAVTRTGDRLGTGGGWYDRALAHAGDAVTVALVNDDEILDALPTHPWDRRMDVVITPTQVLSTW